MYKHPRARERGRDDRDPEEPLETRPPRHHILETVDGGLPEKLEEIVYCEMTDEQKGIYKTVLQRSLQRIDEISKCSLALRLSSC